MRLLKRIINRVLRTFETGRIRSGRKNVYLTFDDGPEPGITEFVLESLDEYGFKGTFFCRGDNAERNPYLLEEVKRRGHRIGNHTYSHIHSYEVNTPEYVNDVEHANGILNTALFRPPHGSLTLPTWFQLNKRYRIVSWALNSEDSDLGKFNLEHAVTNLETKTRSGDIVLFHFCHRHEKETRQILPCYLKWLYEQGYHSDVI